MVIDDLDEVLSQAVDKHEREEAFSNDGLDKNLSQSLDMFEEVKNSVEDTIDITDMFEFEGCVFGYGSDKREKLKYIIYLSIFGKKNLKHPVR